MLLFIDTTDHDEGRIALVGEQIVWHKFRTRDLSENLLPEIKFFLKKQKAKIEQLKKLAVVTGPGGFSRTRTGVAAVNALAYGLKIPVIPLQSDFDMKNLPQLHKYKSQKMVEPYYDRQPTITLSNK